MNVKLCFMSFLLIGGMTLSSCSSKDDFEQESVEQTNPNGEHTLTMTLNGQCPNFGDASSRATYSWPDGAKLYLQFTNGNSVVSGNAVYSKTNDVWTVSYYGTIVSGASTKCEAYYFDGAVASNSSIVNLNDRSAIYQDLSGSYLYSNNTLSVTANLKPKTGRMRFTGTKGLPIKLTGISHYTSYDVSSNSFFTTDAVVADTVSSTTGYTPYLYGYFTDESTPSIGLVSNSSEAYTMSCATTMYKTGDSGYLTIPTDASHNGWASGLNFTVKDISFKMIPVDYSGGSFLIGETEVTNALYYAVTGGTTTEPTLPASNINYSGFSLFLTKLNALTSLTFRFPNAYEWEYAAKGGKKSLGFTYSGSNTVGNVAWYSGNTTTQQPVKQKEPNELGIYDMSGNVAEWTSSSFSSNYSNYYYGGNYLSDASSVTNGSSSYYYNYSYRETSIGMRLALTFK